MKKFISNYFIPIFLGALLAISFMTPFYTYTVVESKAEEKQALTDTLTLDNQSEVDIYLTEDGQWVVISLDDLKYITKKNRTAREVIKNLDSLFARLELPVKEPLKPEVK